MYINQFLTISISFLISYILYKLSIPYLKIFLLDKPNERSSHSKSTPTGGGIVFIFTTIICSLIETYKYGLNFFVITPLLSIPLIIISLIDDINRLPIKYRFFSQIFTGSIFTYYFLKNNQQLSLIYLILLFFILLFCSIALINFINFMDGIDGLISGSFIIILISFVNQGFTSFSLLTLIGSLIAFLFFNWNPAKVFMGDIGSTFLAAIFLGALFQSQKLENMIPNILIITPLISDAISCLIRRKMNNQNIFKPHKLHLYQRLHQAGISHSNVSLIYLGGIFLLALTYNYFNIYILLYLAIIEIFIGYLLDKNVAIKFSKN